MTATGWTLDELIGEVAAQLDSTPYAGAPNGRVRDVPDARAVRWYTTIGLVDRPQMRGRTAFYGPRHLLQLMAIKLRQSQGFKIAEIQAELAQAPDDVLQRIAELPATPVPPAKPSAPSPEVRFWAEPPAEYVRPAPVPPRRLESGAATSGLLSGVPLGGGVVLLLPATPTVDDLAAVRSAARELMETLAARGLVVPDDDGPATGGRQADARRRVHRDEPDERQPEPVTHGGVATGEATDHMANETTKGRGKAR
ncbi:MerR family transcriptional regulator [Dactylosporangium sp. CA-233914]|uniref:MerR family transcriptional regulator n=1 Tax=Dactylosporangium sp. CA-233914 TaxID=3239934 RepID=UPI003D8F89BD